VFQRNLQPPYPGYKMETPDSSNMSGPFTRLHAHTFQKIILICITIINHASAIHNVFVDTSRLYSYIFPLINALPDHDAQCLIFDKFFDSDNRNNNKARNKFKTRLIMDETINYFTEQLLNETWEELYHNTDVSSVFNYFLSTF
jgi:hypothetical protein